jgi:RNA polymerase sigma-70 factor (ECF subfamily)
MQTHLRASQRPSELTDAILIQQAQSGDDSAFAILVGRYSPLLFHLIASRVRDEDLAQDVLQHVFLQLYRGFPTLQPDETIKSWLCQVAHHRCIDELRRKRPILFSEMGEGPGGEALSFLAALPDTDQLPQEQLELLELRQRILRAIERLPACVRAVVWLRYAQQLSFREIGQALCIPESRAKTYFHRARKPLRTLLASEFANGIRRE